MTVEFISSEAVGEGHPDKVADYISDSILDACLEQDKNARVACETLVKSNCVVLAGEITMQAQVDYELVTRNAIRDIGYTDPNDLFNANTVFIHNLLTPQSGEIADAVVKADHGIGAGDQGFFFGYACDETPEYLPASYLLAQKLCKTLATYRKTKRVPWLKPDCKALVTMRYENGSPIDVQNVVLAIQHADSVSLKEIYEFCKEQLIPEIIPGHWLSDNTMYYINTSGSFIHGGPSVDSGLTGRKIIVDTYGGWAHHGGGAFSGKDPSKVDRSGAYFCRWVAKNIVAAELAKRVEVRLAYAIGGTKPIHYDLTTYGTENCDLGRLREAIAKIFDARPFAILETLNLRNPIYKSTTQFGHFTKTNLPWEQTNRVQELLNRCVR
ncbi:MAG: methionine adenosyltransferase [Puniceicoccales bacterium]|jgi:S-adenosylmethionine synthetase|nr:methionine adenosyltransferase [Puniceicoccales bacterium]